jgi:Fe-S-cluster containining protein
MARRPRAFRTSEPANDLLGELEAVLASADQVFTGWSCPASTECCRFGVTGREPYVTSVEISLIRRAIAARGGAKSWKRASALPSAADAADRRSLPLVVEERRCPMLTEAGRCAIYASRPLGCRTFFCDRASSAGRVRHREVGALVREVQAIAARHESAGDQGRPLTRALADLIGKNQ